MLKKLLQIIAFVAVVQAFEFDIELAPRIVNGTDAKVCKQLKAISERQLVLL